MDSWKNHQVITRSNIILLIWLQTQVPKAQREYYNSIAVTILQRRPRKLSAFSSTRYFQLDVEDLALETCVAYAPCCVPAENTHKRNQNYGHKPKFLVTCQQSQEESSCHEQLNWTALTYFPQITPGTVGRICTTLLREHWKSET